MENNKSKKVESKVEYKGLDLSLLNISEEVEAEQESFIKTDITMKITGYAINIDNPMKCQVKNSHFDELGVLHEQTFTVNSEKVITEDIMNKFLNKTVKVEDVERYVSPIKDMNGTIINEEVYYGANLEDLKIVEDIEDEIEVNSYVEVELSSVANKMKKGKATGSIILYSTVKDGNTTKSFECVFDNKELNGHKLERGQVLHLVGKKIRINNIIKSRFMGKISYKTYSMFSLAK